jgi:Xaa-Pro aminopeptidase
MQMNAEITKPRREKLSAAMEPNQVAIVFARMEQEGIEKFTQDNNFLYFTGLMVPDAIFCLHKTKDKVIEYLFIQRGIPELEVWEGKKLTVEEARQISGIEAVKYLDEFYSAASGVMPSVSKIWANIGNPMLTRPLSYPMFMLQPIRNIYSNIFIENLNNLIRPIRSIKTAWEIEQMQKAIDFTGLGITKAMQKAKSGMMEYELEAKMFYQMQKSGVKKWGFAPIIASGVNATTLHYEKNNCEIGPDDVVLMDVGASYLNYSADITRCFPISGKFTPRQRQVYEEVLGIQKAIIDMIKPGLGLVQLNEKTVELIQEALIRLGLIQDKEHYRRYYMHSIGHHLGMDTHDLGARDSALEAGNVITVEPGIYIPEENLGIRIEDDVLVTDTGNIILSKDIPKEADELERIRQEALK